MNVNYRGGINTAESEGRIIRGIESSDLHGAAPPEGSLNHFNTRPIDEVAADLLSVLRLKDYPKALVLGSGTGSEGQDIQQAVPTAQVHGVALTPCNPYLRVILPFHEIYERVLKVVGFDVLHARRMETAYGKYFETQRQEYLQMPDDQYEQKKKAIIGSEPRTDQGCHVPTSLVEELQNSGKIDVFDELPSPSIHRQYIGRFPEHILPEGNYDFVYENHGPLYYVDEEKRGTSKDSLITAYHLLSDQGMLYSGSCWPLDRIPKSRRALIDAHGEQEALFLHDMTTQLLIVQKQNPLHDSLHAVLASHVHQCEEGVFQVRGNFRTLIQEALRMK